MRVIGLSMLAAIKALVLVVLIRSTGAPDALILWLNGGFVLLYLASTAFTYAALSRPAKVF
jgi:hypothetical protein